MKKILLAYGALILVIVLVAFVKFKGGVIFPNFAQSPTAEINNVKVTLMVADDEEEMQKGLSKRKELKENTGMIFLFEKSGKYSFWMKDVEFPLDIIYLQGDTIIDIKKNVPPQAGNEGVLPVYVPVADSNRVLEVNGGFSDKNRLKVGDKITLKGVK